VSGPKVYRLSESQIARLREDNRRKCEQSLCELKRIVKEREALADRLAELGSDSVPSARVEAGDVRDKCERLIESNTGNNAPGYVDRELDQAKKELKDYEKAFEKRVQDLQERSRRFREERRKFIQQKEVLAAAISPALTKGWPEEEVKALKKSSDSALKKLVGPPEFSLELTKSSVRELEKSEEKLRGAFQDYDAARQKIEREIEDAHRRIIGSRLAAKAAAPITLSKLLPKLNSTPPPAPAADEYAEKVEKMLLKMERLKEFPDWKIIRRKAAEIISQPDARRKAQLYTSLQIECGERLNHLKKVERMREEIFQLIKESADANRGEVLKITSKLEKIGKAGVLVDLQPLRAALTKALKDERALARRERSRDAVLESLAELGYELKHDLKTGVVADGGFYVWKPGDRDYGVEFSFGAEVDADGIDFNCEVVRFADNTNPAVQVEGVRGKEKEDEWCRDYERARLLLQQKGQPMTAKTQKKAGVHPVKVVRVDKQEQRTDNRAAKLQSFQSEG